VERVYRDAREAGMGDGASAAIAFALFTDAEKGHSDAHPLDALSKPARPPLRAAG
jgi:hypothetical protein